MVYSPTLPSVGDPALRILLPIVIPATLLGACDQQEGARDDSTSSSVDAGSSGAQTTDGAEQAAAHWVLQRSAKDTTLTLTMQAGDRILSLTCASGENRLQINVSSFTPIGSEDRLSFGSDGEVEALVADFRGDQQLGGVGADGIVPANLAALLGGPISASYGAQTSGPHPSVPRDIAGSFVAACRSATASATSAAMQGSAVSPCLMQDGQKLSVQPLRAIGTEPFWAARIEGRCVTYSHPEDQQGTRVWARFTPTPNGGVWSGALGGRQFELRTRAAPGCSDGMSEKSYPVAVDLLVNGERRKGCTEPM